MNHLPIAFRGPVLACVLGAGSVLTGCGGYIMADGVEADYVTPPVGIEVYPRYAYADGYVYDVHGRYYHRHGDRWVAYRHAPPGMRRVHDERGRAERQR